MKNEQELEGICNQIYWCVENGEYKKAIEKLDKLQKKDAEKQEIQPDNNVKAPNYNITRGCY